MLTAAAASLARLRSLSFTSFASTLSYINHIFQNCRHWRVGLNLPKKKVVIEPSMPRTIVATFNMHLCFIYKKRPNYPR